MDASGYIEMRSYFCSSSTNANLLITEALSSIAWGELPLLFKIWFILLLTLARQSMQIMLQMVCGLFPITVHPISTSYLNLPNLLNKNL